VLQMKNMTKKGTKWRSQTTAMQCAYFMRFYGYEPKTILNIGLGLAFELEIWHWLLLEAKIVGIDPMSKHRFLVNCPAWPTMRYVQAAAYTEAGSARHCSACHSLCCASEAEHGQYHRDVQTVCIDDIARDHEPPYFIWIDIDGGELFALQGAEKTIEKTDWLNAEFHEWRKGSVAELESWILAKGFHLFFHHPKFEDRLYQKMFADNLTYVNPMHELIDCRESLKMAAERERLRVI